MSKKAREQLAGLLEAQPPINLEEIRSIDYIGCPRCGVVFTISEKTQLEHRRIADDQDGWFGPSTVRIETVEKSGPDTVAGIFCPNCGQRTHDEESWPDHLAERKVYDRDEGTGHGPRSEFEEGADEDAEGEDVAA